EVKGPPLVTPDPLPGKKRATPLNPANIQRISNAVSLRPFRDRVIHLLALKNFKKPELLAHLKRDGIMPKDRDSLGKILQQVANMNPKENSFSLKEHFFKDIQKDWPGYSETDRRTLEMILARQSAPSPNATSTSHSTSQGPSDGAGPSRTSQKRPLDSSSPCPVMTKKQRI
ncbi:ELL2 factor, partial [Campylorhamphus procurvoides]|nr:ELL2 factor [Campylorhamphus procurvoides]